MLALLCGCTPRTTDRGPLEIPTDFKQSTKYPELTDDDYTNGHIGYMIAPEDDFVTICVYGVVDEDQIKSIIEEFKVAMKKRNLTPHLVAKIYDTLTVIDEDNLQAGTLIKTVEIKDF
jgi:phage terminase large subunit-like protein